MQLTDTNMTLFQEAVWNYFKTSARSMPWRDNPEPYCVLVSELMLQQTQVNRVVPKFQAFMKCFPTIEALASAPLSKVLRVWSGLGYNRRAKYLHQTAQVIVEQHHSQLPASLDQLIVLPGIGKNTAGALLAYAYNRPVVFIETNIRTVYFHHFFSDQTNIDDKELLKLIEQTLDREHPREWYWALMDYGTFLKKTLGNNIDHSRHYTKQSKFEGSRRQLRGKILRLLLERPYTSNELVYVLSDARSQFVLNELQKEHFVVETEGILKLTDQSELP